MTPRRLAGPCRALLGAVGGPVLVAGPDTRGWPAALAAVGVPLAGDGEAAAAVLVLLRERGDPAVRAAALARLAERLPAAAPVVLVDHNQPRAPWRRAGAWGGLLLRGHPPARARYPAARELAAAGFTVESLCFAAGERVQLVRAHRTAGSAARGPIRSD